MRKHITVWLLLAVMLLCIGCGKKTDPAEGTEDTPIRVEEPTEPERTDTGEKEQDDRNEGDRRDEEAELPDSSDDSSDTYETMTSSKTYYIKVNCRMNTVTVYTKDSDGRFTVPYKAMICSTGASTPTGTYDISGCGRWRWLRLVDGVCGQYCTQIIGDYLFHSVPYTQWKDKGSLQPGEYDKLGTTCSHGCIRLIVADAKWIYNNMYEIAAVELYHADDPGPLGKPAAQKIGSSDYKGWDPTDPDPDNPWRNAAVTVGSYVGKQAAEAVGQAKDAGLSVGESTYQYSDQAEGTVIAQSLRSGASVKKGTVITFTVSKGAEPVTVISYVKMALEEAKASAEALGLQVEVQYEAGDTDGVVLKQSIDAGTSVAVGTTIVLTVSQVQEMPDPPTEPTGET